MAQIATLLTDRARREGSAYVGRADLDLVGPLEIGQVVIIEDISTGDRLLGWIADVIGADTETVYRFALGPVLPARFAPELAHLPRRRQSLQGIEKLLDEARERGLQVPQPRDANDELTPEDS